MAIRLALALLATCLLLAPGLNAEDVRFFRIGTGGVTGTYYPIGGLIAGIISNPPGSRPCEKGGSCGVPGLIVTAQSSGGSVANVEAVARGELDSGFAQSDIAFWTYSGTEIYQSKERLDNLRAIANLYPESIHLVVRRGAGIEGIADLEGKRVSVDEPGSGTLVNAHAILDAYGIGEDDVDLRHIKPNFAIADMREGRLDAFFFTVGYPASSVTELAESETIDLIPIIGPEVDRLLENHEFFAKDVIPAGTYPGIGEVETLSVGAQWIVAAEADEALVYGMTKALWHESARALLDAGHAKGRAITTQTALDGIAIPLHPGAERYYREAGLLPEGS
jgi:hypothetical protein